MSYDREEAERLLEIVKATQQMYWGAVFELEAALGIEVDTTWDFAEMTLEELETRTEAAEEEEPF
jgi:hypothetical protein